VPAAPARDRAQLVVFACQSGLAIPGTSAGPAHCTRGEQITQFGTGSDMPAATPWSSFRRDCAAAALRWWGGRCPGAGSVRPGTHDLPPQDYVPALSTPARLRSSTHDAVAVCYRFVT